MQGKKKKKDLKANAKAFSSATVSIYQSKIKEIKNRIKSPDVPCR